MLQLRYDLMMGQNKHQQCKDGVIEEDDDGFVIMAD